MPISNQPVSKPTLRVQVKRGAYLQTPTFSTLCPRVDIRYGNCQAHTAVVEGGGSAPNWPETFFDFPFDVNIKTIDFVLVHAPKGKKEENMAELSVNVKDTLGFDKWYSDTLHLKKKGMLGSSKFAGNLHVAMEVVEPTCVPQQPPQQPQMMAAPMPVPMPVQHPATAPHFQQQQQPMGQSMACGSMVGSSMATSSLGTASVGTPPINSAASFSGFDSPKNVNPNAPKKNKNILPLKVHSTDELPSAPPAPRQKFQGGNGVVTGSILNFDRSRRGSDPFKMPQETPESVTTAETANSLPIASMSILQAEAESKTTAPPSASSTPPKDDDKSDAKSDVKSTTDDKNNDDTPPIISSQPSEPQVTGVTADFKPVANPDRKVDKPFWPEKTTDLRNPLDDVLPDKDGMPNVRGVIMKKTVIDDGIVLDEFGRPYGPGSADGPQENLKGAGGVVVPGDVDYVSGGHKAMTPETQARLDAHLKRQETQFSSAASSVGPSASQVGQMSPMPQQQPQQVVYQQSPVMAPAPGPTITQQAPACTGGPAGPQIIHNPIPPAPQSSLDASVNSVLGSVGNLFGRRQQTAYTTNGNGQYYMQQGGSYAYGQPQYQQQYQPQQVTYMQPSQPGQVNAYQPQQQQYVGQPYQPQQQVAYQPQQQQVYHQQSPQMMPPQQPQQMQQSPPQSPPQQPQQQNPNPPPTAPQ